MVPNGWAMVSLKECLSFLRSGLSRKLSNEDIGLPVIRSGNMTDSEVEFSEIKYWHIDDPQGANTSNYYLDDGDLLVNFINSQAQIGKTCIFINRIGRPCIYTTNILRAKHSEITTASYLFYITKTKGYSDYVQSITKPAVNQASFTTEEFKRYSFLLPPLPEQKKISQILSIWDEAIEANEQLLANSRLRKKALMQKLLTGETRLPGFVGKWKTTTLSDIGHSYTGLSGKTKEDFGQGLPYIPYKNIFFNRKVDSDFLDYVVVKDGERQSLVQAGDILFTTSSETPEEVGMSSVLLNDLGILYLNSFCFGFRPSSTDVLDSVFASFYFRSAGMRKVISKLAQGATRYNISASRLIKLKLEIPGIPEQRAIAEILTVADCEIEALEQRINNLKLQKKALMQQLLTGKKRVAVESVAA